MTAVTQMTGQTVYSEMPVTSVITVTNRKYEKEKKAREHLKNTYILVGRLNNNDIKMMENMRKVSKEKDQRELN